MVEGTHNGINPMGRSCTLNFLKPNSSLALGLAFSKVAFASTLDIVSNLMDSGNLTSRPLTANHLSVSCLSCIRLYTLRSGSLVDYVTPWPWPLPWPSLSPSPSPLPSVWHHPWPWPWPLPLPRRVTGNMPRPSLCLRCRHQSL